MTTNILPLPDPAQLLDSLGQAVIVTDLTGVITYWSKGAEKLYGWEKQEVLGKNVLEITPSDLTKEQALSIFEILQKGASWQGEFNVKKKDGSFFTAYVIDAPILDAQGKLCGIIGTSRDFLFQKQLEDSLRRDKAKDEAIIASLGLGLVVVDKTGKITIVNKAFTDLLGWQDNEVVGKDVSEAIVKETESGERIPFKELFINKVLRGEPLEFDVIKPYYFLKKDGKRIPVFSITTPIIFNGEVIGAVETFRDITREIEIDRAKTEFVSLASHQLRTPLSTINWYVETLLSETLGSTTEKQKEYLEQVYKSSQRMVDLVNALLNISRIELGTFLIDPKPTDFRQIADEILSELSHLISERGVVFKKTYDENLPLVVVDPKLLRIIFQNLLTNSIKYTPPKGTVTLDIRLHKSDILITVSDSGCGIPKAQQSQIFTKLFRADNVKELETDGTGLGLYIAKAITDHSGGRIWFESEENKGTIFYVALPTSGMKANKGYKVLN